MATQVHAGLRGFRADRLSERSSNGTVVTAIAEYQNNHQPRGVWLVPVQRQRDRDGRADPLGDWERSRNWQTDSRKIDVVTRNGNLLTCNVVFDFSGISEADAVAVLFLVWQPDTTYFLEGYVPTPAWEPDKARMSLDEAIAIEKSFSFGVDQAWMLRP